MTFVRLDRKRLILLMLLILTLTANLALYRLPFEMIPASDMTGVVIGSLFDFIIVVPLLIMLITRNRGFTIKRFITFMVLSILAARFIIPPSYFEPFQIVPYAAIAMEGVILFAEIGLLFMLVKKTPQIMKDVKASGETPLFSFAAAVEKRVSSHPLVRIISAEVVMFYYALASWKRRLKTGENHFTLHTKTSFVALEIMLIHAIVFETLAIHWWLHGVSLILSIVLLILNVYSIIFFIGDIQAVRLNPVVVERKQIRVSLGLGKRMVIPFDEIADIVWDEEAAKENLKKKDTIDFVARDFDDVLPQCVITLKSPCRATLFLGFQKKYTKVAIRVDDLVRFRNYLNNVLEKGDND